VEQAERKKAAKAKREAAIQPTLFPDR